MQQLQDQIRKVKDLLGASARRGASVPEIAIAEDRFGVRFPTDLKLLVSAFNGSDEGTPVENGWVTFWSLST